MAARAQVLEARLLQFGVDVGAAARSMPRDPAGRTIATQLARAGMSPGANYAEARASVSSRDYAFKMQLCLKELRETMYWLKAAERSGFRNADYAALIAECNELTAIVVTCVKKAKGTE